MRFDGTLVKWNDDRGFGFVAATQGGQEVFVHISSFPRDGRRPQLNEKLSFEVELNKDGKKRAINVRRPGRPANAYVAPSVPSSYRPRRESRGTVGSVVAVVMVVALAVYGYHRYSNKVAAYAPSGGVQSGIVAPSPSARPLQLDARCDGRTYCSQMTSCAEAMFFLKNCPGTQMDGNNDGVPCERQWCTGQGAK